MIEKYTPAALDAFEPAAIDIFGRDWGKYASASYTPPKVEEYLKTAEPMEGHRIILVHGLGSSEYWGANRNGDAFPEHMVGPAGVKEATLINTDPDKDWGVITFEKYAHAFRDHKNQDPKLTIGGKVILADWNPEMHRVEIVMPISEKLAGDVVAMIDAGEPVEVSMGCKVAYDVCTTCGNKAKNRGYYCKHARYEMGKRLPDGRKHAVLNPRPKFFDISVVKKGADRGAKMLMKVASSAQIVVPDWPDHKTIVAGSKLSDISKQIPGAIKDVAPSDELSRLEKDLESRFVQMDNATATPLPPKVARLIRAYPEEALSALASAGVVLMPHEMPKLASIRLGSYRPEIWTGIDVSDLMQKRSMYTPFFTMRVFRKAARLKHGLDKAPESIKVAASDAASTYQTYIEALGEIFRDGDKLAALFKRANDDERVTFQLTRGVDQWIAASKHAQDCSMNDIADFLGYSTEKRAVAIPEGVGKALEWGARGAKGLGRGAAEVMGMGATPAFPFSAGVAGAGAPLLMSQFFANKMQRGEDPGLIGRTVAKHPLLSSAAGLLGSMKLHSAMSRWRPQ